MADEPENHTLRLLQEMRAEIQDMREDLTAKMDGNTLIMNALAGHFYQHEERLERMEHHLSLSDE